MSSLVSVRSLTLGDGHCKIILPIVASDRSAILRSAAQCVQLGADLVEWRADFYTGLDSPMHVSETLRLLRQALGDTPLLVTWRSKREGGEREAESLPYLTFYRTVCESGYADLIDVELFMDPATLYSIIELARQNNCRVVCSSHDFEATPTFDEMLNRLCRMQQLGADIAKLAVMPQSEQDVAALLAVTAAMKTQHPSTPVITMSMGELGQISRIAGAKLGSCATFASAGAASAPGQLAYADARELLRLLNA